MQLSLTPDSELFLQVQDNGKGVPPEIIPHLFKRGASFHKPNGKGLGLFLAKECIEMYCGRQVGDRELIG